MCEMICLHQLRSLAWSSVLVAMHPVAALMEFCLRRRLLNPVYELIENCGPAHRKTFKYKVSVVVLRNVSRFICYILCFVLLSYYVAPELLLLSETEKLC